MSANVRKLKIYFIFFFIVQTFLIIGNFALEYKDNKDKVVALARMEANSAYLKDTLYRRWNSLHGGVYVPVSEKAQPNPYLIHIKNRDIETKDGMKLTLINPAYMTRQVFEMAKETDVIQGHLTSTKLTNPINKPDQWEVNALKKIYLGEKEFYSIDNIDGKPFLRFMRPFKTEKGCLRCHELQGYKVGDIRGGVSVEVPLEELMKSFNSKLYWLVIINTLIWLMGVLVLLTTYKKLRLIIIREEYLRKDREDLLRELNHRVKNNLQIIFSMLDLQITTAENDETVDVLREVQNRLLAMTTMHNMLEFDDNVAGVSSVEYLKKLITYFETAYLGREGVDVKVVYDIDDFKMSVTQAVSCGLILNELMTNSYKHAFDKNSEAPKIEVGFKRHNGNIKVYVRDNGKGFKNLKNLERSGSYGMLLMNSMAAKINARITMNGDNGMNAEFVFSVKS